MDNCNTSDLKEFILNETILNLSSPNMSPYLAFNTNPDNYITDFSQFLQLLNSDEGTTSRIEELSPLSYPLFIYYIINLISAQRYTLARQFYATHSKLYSSKQLEIFSNINPLITESSTISIKLNAALQSYRDNKFNIKISSEGFNKLIEFLSSQKSCNSSILYLLQNKFLIDMANTNDTTEKRKSLKRSVTSHSTSIDKQESNKPAKTLTSTNPPQRKTSTTESGNTNTPAISSSLQQCNTIEELDALIAVLSNVPPLINALQFNVNYPNSSNTITTTNSSNSSSTTTASSSSNSSINNVISASYSFQGSTILTGHSNGAIRLWSINEADNINASMQKDAKYTFDINDLYLPPLSSVDSMLFNPTMQNKEKFNVNLQSDEYCPIIPSYPEELRVHSEGVYSITHAHNSQYALSGSEDGIVYLWDLLKLPKPIVKYTCHQFYIWDIAVPKSSHTDYFATASQDKTARLWSTERKYPLRIFAGHTSSVSTVDFHPNCVYIATGGYDGVIRLWNSQDGSCVRILCAGQGYISSVKFSPDGKLLASGGEDGFVRVWDIAESKILKEFELKSQIIDMDFASDSRLISVGNFDYTMSILDLSDRKLDNKPLYSYDLCKASPLCVNFPKVNFCSIVCKN